MKMLGEHTMKTFLFVLLLTLVRAVPCFGELVCGYTPEVLSHEAALIFVGVPQRAESKNPIGNRWVTVAQFRIDKMIKGPLAAGDLVTIVSLESEGLVDLMDLAGAVARKREVLVLAIEAKKAIPESGGRYVLQSHAPDRSCAFYADEPVKNVYTEKGAAIREYGELLKRMEAQCAKEAGLRRHWKGQIEKRRTTVEIDSDAFKELYSRSAVLIFVLEYKEAEEREPTK
jgi:hypothetical protein